MVAFCLVVITSYTLNIQFLQDSSYDGYVKVFPGRKHRRAMSFVTWLTYQIIHQYTCTIDLACNLILQYFLFQNIIYEYYPRVEQFESRPGPIFCIPSHVSKLLAKVISRRRTSSKAGEVFKKPGKHRYRYSIEGVKCKRSIYRMSYKAMLNTSTWGLISILLTPNLRPTFCDCLNTKNRYARMEAS